MDDDFQPPNGLTTPRLRALYAAVVAGLVAFIAVALLLLPAPIHSYRCGVVLEQTAEVGNQEPLELELLTQSQVEQFAQDVFARWSAEAHLKTAFTDAVACRVERPVPHRIRIEIETQDRYADRSLHLCRSIADELLKRSEKAFVPGLTALCSQRSNVEQRLALVRDAKRAAEDELTSLSNEHVAHVTSAMQQAAATTPAADKAPDDVYSESQRLRSQWEQLLAQRSELARNKTDEHPQIKDIDQRLAEMKQRALALATQQPAAQPEPSAASRGELDDLQARFRRRSAELTEAVAAARRREEELLGETARLAITPAPIPLAINMVDQPEVIDRIGGQPSGNQLGILLVLATAAGGLTYACVRRVSAIQKLRSTDDIESQLGLPAIALAESRSLAGAHWGQVVQRSVLAAEIALLLLAGSTILLVALQSQLSRPPAADPFGAVAESLDRTFSPTLRR